MLKEIHAMDIDMNPQKSAGLKGEPYEDNPDMSLCAPLESLAERIAESISEAPEQKTAEEAAGRFIGRHGGEHWCADHRENQSAECSFIKDIFESIIHPLYVLDMKTHRIKATNSAARRAGIMVGETCNASTNHNNMNCESGGLRCPIEEVSRTSLPITLEHTHCDAEGNPRTMEIHGFPVLDSEGRPIQLILYTPDITERRNLEEALQVSYRFLEIANRYSQLEPMLKEFAAELKSYTGCSTVSIRMIDGEGKVSFSVQSGLDQESDEERFHKVDRTLCFCNQVINREFEPTHPLFTKAGSFFTNSTSASYETACEEEKLKLYLVSSGLKYESVAVIPICVGNRAIGVIRLADAEKKRVPVERIHILEKVAMELGAAFQRLKLEEDLAKARDEYLSSLTHDMKNPLTSILSSLRLLADPRLGEISEKKREFLDMTRISCETLLTMINNIINASRLEVGEARCATADFSLSGLLQEVKKIFEPMALLISVTLNFDCPGDIYVTADREKMREVLLNLIGNAIRYTPKGGSISIRTADRGGNVEICVSDTGRGIPEEYHDIIFNKYSQVKGERKGSGLGLYIVKKYLALHGSDITLRSRPGEGAEFIFSLRKGAYRSRQCPESPAVLLLCGDEPLKDFICESLRDEGFAADTAESGSEALSDAVWKKPDVIVVSEKLSRSDRNSFLKILNRSLKEDIPIILLTGSEQSPLEELVAMTLPMPLDTESLKEAVRKVLSSRSAES
jgi:signal transduction histidine kinase